MVAGGLNNKRKTAVVQKKFVYVWLPATPFPACRGHPHEDSQLAAARGGESGGGAAAAREQHGASCRLAGSVARILSG